MSGQFREDQTFFI